ncbi:MAG: GNAT family N-acetyltransferase [Flavobacteriales bacterium]|nr:GNAT family N-acetyltransferase [Flavobacteriales bacterium]
MPIQWTFHRFEALRPVEIHALYKLRVDVFVVEQNCPYPEVDAEDLAAMHVLGVKPDAGLIAYARIIPPHADGLPHIGRVVVHRDHRRNGTGHALLSAVTDHLIATHGSARSALAAQHHLQRFYERHGFAPVGDVYDLDGIPHVDMVRMG